MKATLGFLAAALAAALPAVGAPNDPSPLEFRSLVTHRGVTFHFDQPVPTGSFLNGDPFVVSLAPFQITKITPESVSNGRYIVNGVMVDPFITSEQGFDQSLEQEGFGASTIAYRKELNADPAVGGPIEVARGASHSIVKAKRLPDIGTGGAWRVIDEWVVLTILPEAPPKNAFRPGMGNAAQKIRTFDEINWSTLRNLPLPEGVPTVAEAMSYQKRVLPFFASISGENFRRFQTEDDNYSGTYTPFRTLPAYLLHADIPKDAKAQMAALVIQHGLDVYANYQRGFRGAAGAGQHHGYHFYLWFAAFLLNDSELLTAAQTLRSNMQSHPAWIPESLLGSGVDFPGSSGQLSSYGETFLPDDIGKPFWTEVDRGSNTYARYLTISLVVGGIELLPVLLLQNGPEGITGYQAFLEGPDANGRYDRTNHRAAAIAVRDRVNTWHDLARPFNLGSDQFYNAWRDVIPLPRWTGTPDQVAGAGASMHNFFFAIDGGIRWDISRFNSYSTLPIVDRHVRYSLDQIQWVAFDGQNASGQLTGLIKGVEHFCQIALKNERGRGKWSPNYPVADIGSNARGPRNVVKPSGTDAPQKPFLTVDPALHYKPFPAWAGPAFEPVDTTQALDSNILTLYAGTGYYRAFPAPTFGWQWKRDGVDISGAITNVYNLTPDDLGKKISCVVTAGNASGRTVFETAPALVSLPEELPEGTVVNTDFGGQFALQFADVLAAAVTNNVTLRHQPSFLFNNLEASPGALHGDKTGSWPKWHLVFHRNIRPGKTYRVEAEAVVNYGQEGEWNRGDGFFLISSNGTGKSYLNVKLSPSTAGKAEVIPITGEFTVPADETDLTFRVQMGVNTKSGGRGGGDTYLSKLVITEKP